MDYESKGDYLKKRMIIPIVAVGFSSYYISKNGIPIEVCFFVGSIILLSIYLFLLFFWTKTIGKKIYETPREDIQRFIDSVQKHIHLLARKKRIFVHKDEYGHTIKDRWESEKSAYIKKHAYVPVTTSFYDGITPSQQSIIIDKLVDDYIAENNIKTSYREDMTPSEYEYFCAQVLNDNGWNARTTPSTGDQGVDVIAEKNGVTVAIQCKKYTNPVGNSAVQEVVSGKDYWSANVAIVVTSATYTPSARALAKVHNVHLLHHEQLVELDEII